MNRLIHLFFITIGLTSFTVGSAIGQTHHTDHQQVSQLSQAEAQKNLELVVNFYNEFFNQHNIQAAYKYLDKSYIQHNPYVPDGILPFTDYFAGYFKDNPKSSARIVRTAVNGDLVFLHVHSQKTPQDKGVAGVDIFRVQNGKIVEHWDVNQDVPAQAANKNTMF
ncbi:nuclear transport factor 2 family protein [Neisseria sp. Ec49-e6-T10]|uniref:nuclear transport factor 2 family protein n=1 Tax=Neisseria sp. Ec49-e6-T10 TaxID=3140744 RepID=UPI003EB8423A